MIIIKAAVTSVLSMILMFFLTKLTGDKQISQMSMFDYITGITIGSAGAEMAIGGDVFIPATVVTLLYGVVAFLISWLCNKSIRVRRFVNGEPRILYMDGIFYKKNMSKVRMDMSEFLTQCRNNGFFSLGDVSCAIMETNGKVSFLEKKPVSAKTELAVNIINDGKILNENLKAIDRTKWWVMGELAKRGIKLNEVLLATFEKNKLCIYTYVN